MKFDAMDKKQNIIVTVEAPNREKAIKKIETTMTDAQRVTWEKAHRLMRYFDEREVKQNG